MWHICVPFKLSDYACRMTITVFGVAHDKSCISKGREGGRGTIKSDAKCVLLQSSWHSTIYTSSKC